MSSVNLVAKTEPYNQIGVSNIRTGEQLIAYCGRVSNPANQANNDTADRLINYMIRNQHWSPFEHVYITIEIETPRDIARQILRHRSFTFQEFSQRYATAFAFDYREVRLQDAKNRQSSIQTDDPALKAEWRGMQDQVLSVVKKAYDWALKNNIAKEVARAVLPEGMTMSRLYATGSMRSWIHYCHLRSGNGTQFEHQEIAKSIWGIIREHYPVIAAAVEQMEKEGVQR